MDNLLSIRELYISYGKKIILHGVSLDLPPGQCLGIAGGSGAGKSSLVHALAGILPPSAAVRGEIYWQQQKCDKKLLRSLQGTAITLLPQLPTASLYPLAPVGDQFRYMFPHADKKQIFQRAADILEKLSVSEANQILQRYPFELSGGQNQRVCLAMALMRRPKLLLADEPTSGLDAAAQEEILRQLALFKTPQTAMLLVSHNLGFLAQIADRIIIMQEGRIAEDAPTDELLSAPRHAYTRRLLAAVPHLRLNGGRL